jgi:UDP-3-O-[3-hydroxymyristoyl] glucosamine N-acyltransferase
MSHALREIAAALGARVEGDGERLVRRPAHPSEAGPEDLALAMDARHEGLLPLGRARVALLREGADWRALGLDGAVIVARPRYALAGLTAQFAPPPDIAPGIHALAVVDPAAEIGEGAAIGPFCVVAAGARVGPRTALRAQAFLGAGAEIGPDGLVHPGVRIGHGVRIGARAIIHGNAVIGADGFSFVTPDRGAVESAKATGRVDADARNLRLARIHSLAAVTIGDDVEIGAGACIDRGTVSDTRIGHGTKIDNLAQIGHNVRIGENCMLCGQVGVAGSATLGDRVVLGGQTGVADHVSIGADSVCGARSGVATDLPPGSVVLGAPALPRAEALQIMLAWRRLPALIARMRGVEKRLSAADANG